MRTSNRVRVLLYTVAMLGFAMSASAQNVPSAEFSAGWRLLTLPHAFGEESQTMPLGWYADVAGNLNRAFGVVGEVAGNYKSFTENQTQFGATVRVDADIAFDAGGGVNFNVSDAFAVRTGASYLRVGGSDGGNAFRFGVGLVVPF